MPDQVTIIIMCIYWMVLKLVLSNGTYVGVAKIDPFMKVCHKISNVKVHLKTNSGNVMIIQIVYICFMILKGML